MIIKKQYFPSR